MKNNHKTCSETSKEVRVHASELGRSYGPRPLKSTGGHGAFKALVTWDMGIKMIVTWDMDIS